MIRYNPNDSDASRVGVEYYPKTCFLMTKLGADAPPIVTEARKAVAKALKSRAIKVKDAESVVTGRDFLLKIWKMMLGVPLGIAVIDKAMSPQTLSNIFYEMGVLQAYGKEVLVVKTPGTKVPSDFIRTEYVAYDGEFSRSMKKFLDTFVLLEEYFATMADNLEGNPLLSIDYLRRAYLINPDQSHRKNAKRLSKELNLAARAKDSVENLLIGF